MSIAPARTWDIDALVSLVSEIVAKESGNVLGDNQKSMVVNRLKKRMIDLGDLSPDDYYEHLQTHYQREVTHLVSLLTTHHTFFFREFCHFEYLLQNLETIVQRVHKRGERKLRILSAACSRGQEVYSLAMFFQHHLKAYQMDYDILGTDIDPESVKFAQNGVYPYTEVKSIPQIYLNGNWQRGTGEIARFAKVKNHLKEHCSFKVMNLLNPEATLTGLRFDIVFCRNVFIYFNLADVEKIVGNFKKYLHQDALFITGLSESLKSLSLEKQTFAPSVYGFDPPVQAPMETSDPVVAKTREPHRIVSKIPTPIRILAVDDSSSVLKLLSKIFSSDPAFELVGTASNGLEAQEFLKLNQVDAMTLDIHMPQMDGVEYLKRNFKKGHPHVVVVSSASREDTRYAQETLKHGASDFVEKPALNNLSERAEEIKNKIKMSFLNATPMPAAVEQSFARSFEIPNPQKKARFMVASFSDRHKVKASLGELKGTQPPIFLFFEGNSNFMQIIQDELKGTSSIDLYEGSQAPAPGRIYLCDLKRDFTALGEQYSWPKISLAVFGIVSQALEKHLFEYQIGQVLIEDTPSINQHLKEVASDIFPWTSFSHMATEFLAKVDSDGD